MGFGWSEVNLIQKPGSHRRMKHSIETKGHRKKKPTHLDRSQPAYVHTFGNNFVQIVLLLFYGHAILFYLLYIFGKINFLWYQKILSKRTENFSAIFQTYRILMFEYGLDSLPWIVCEFFFAKHTAAHALEHCKQSSLLTVFSSKQRHNFQFNKFHAAHGLLYWYE